MVGAIADWFAVTALFKHPLGLPIPHTALIPRRKDELGRSLEEFVGENFLQESIIRERIDAARLERAGGRRGSTEEAQRPPGRRRGRRRAARSGWQRIRDEDMVALVEEALLPRFLRRADQPGRRQPARGGRPRRRPPRAGRPGPRGGAPLADRTTRRPSPRSSAERAPWWSPPRAQRPRSPHRLHLEAVALGRRHPRRPATTTRARRSTALLAQLADDLLHDPATQERAERLKDRVLDAPAAGGHRRCRCGTRSGARCWRRSTTPTGPLRAARVSELARVRRAAARRTRRCATRLDALRRGPRGLRGRPLRRRADRRDHPHRSTAGTARRPPATHRAARRPRPAVHPDQRHHRRRPGRRAHPRRQRAALSPGGDRSRARLPAPAGAEQVGGRAVHGHLEPVGLAQVRAVDGDPAAGWPPSRARRRSDSHGEPAASGRSWLKRGCRR